MLAFFGTSNIKLFVRRYFESRSDLEGKRVIDLPAGKGYMSDVLNRLGATVEPYDLFTEFFDVEGLECKDANLSEPLPIADGQADIALCQEGLEHLPDQLFALRQFNRILKKGGSLFITVPNISHLRAKASNFLTESDYWKRMPSNELDAVWFSGDDKNKMYFGHIFLLGIQKLRVLAVASGFELVKVHPVKASITSVLLGVSYPLIVLANLYAWVRNVYLDDGVDQNKKKKVYWQIVKLNIHPAILFGRHLFIEFRKVTELDDLELYVNWRN